MILLFLIFVFFVFDFNQALHLERHCALVVGHPSKIGLKIIFLNKCPESELQNIPPKLIKFTGPNDIESIEILSDIHLGTIIAIDKKPERYKRGLEGMLIEFGFELYQMGNIQENIRAGPKKNY